MNTKFAHIARPALAVSLVLLVAACGGGGPAATTPGSQPTKAPEATKPAEGEPTPGTALTACELVTPADIEQALDLDAGTVAAGELKQQPTSLDPAGNECRYSDEKWGGLIVSVTPTDGVNVYDALKKAYGDTAEALQVGDGAYWFENNDRGYFLKGAVLVRLQFQYIVSGMKFREPTIQIGTAAIGRV